MAPDSLARYQSIDQEWPILYFEGIALTSKFQPVILTSGLLQSVLPWAISYALELRIFSITILRLLWSSTYDLVDEKEF